MNELIEILEGLKNEICPAITDINQRDILTSNFDRALDIARDVSKEENIDFLRGKVEAFEKILGGKQ